MNPTVLDASVSYHAAGLSVVPCSASTKRPLVGDWEQYQKIQIDRPSLTHGVQSSGAVGIITGYGDVEAIDFDLKGFAWRAWRDLVLEEDPDLLQRCYVERSPSGGWHVVYRCSEIEGNVKLASYRFPITQAGAGLLRRHDRDLPYVAEAGEKAGALIVKPGGSTKGYEVRKGVCTLVPIETRGKGGFLVVAPTLGYVKQWGALDALPVLTPGERAVLIGAARAIGDRVEVVAEAKASRGVVAGEEHRPDEYDDENDDRIGTHFNKVGDYAALLEAHGWTKHGKVRGPNEYWVRPGKDRRDGWSASWHTEQRLFYVFTSSTVLRMSCAKEEQMADGQGHAYSYFKLYAELEHDGDYKAATKRLIKDNPEVARELEMKGLMAVIAEESVDAEEAEAIKQQIEMDAGRPAMSINPPQFRVYMAIRMFMRKRKLTFDALENIRCNGELHSMDINQLGLEILTNMRNEHVPSADAVRDTLQVLRGRDARRRRAEIVKAMCGKPSTAEGERELEKLLGAVSDAWTETDKIALKLLMWNTKVKQTGGYGESHHCVVFYNPHQEAGKSVMARKFISPWGELSVGKFSIKFITDERCTPMLSKLAIGNVDEMAGMDKADIDEVKGTITAARAMYRPMRTNDAVEVPMMMSFVATSNNPVSELVRDTSGNRRFYELKTKHTLDWDVINNIDYGLVWQAVSESDRCPAFDNRAGLRAVNAKTAYKDSVEQWLEYEDDNAVNGVWGENSVDRINPADGVKYEVLYARYAAWCRTFEMRPLAGNRLGGRLTGFSMGWEMRKPHGQPRRYYRNTLDDL